MTFMRMVSFASISASALALSASCATEPATDSASSFVRSGPSTLDPPLAPDPAPSRRLVHPALTKGAKQVGYYDMSAGFGQNYEISPITAAGGTAVLIDDPSASELANLNVLFVTNPENGFYGSGYLNRLSDIAAAVKKGMILVIHDREVSDAASILPDGQAFSIIRDFTEDADINIHDASTVVTTGLTDASLDGGDSSSHGFAIDTSLPAKAKLFLSQTTPSHIVTFCYPEGQGAVIYSTIPLDFYLQGLGPNPPQANLANIYAPNVVKYALAGACGHPSGPQPTPNVVRP